MQVLVDEIVLESLKYFDGELYRIISNCEYVKNATIRKSAKDGLIGTEKCQSLEVRRAIDQLDICERSQKLAWTTKLKSHRTASSLEQRYTLPSTILLYVGSKFLL